MLHGSILASIRPVKVDIEANGTAMVVEERYGEDTGVEYGCSGGFE
jgi:hypothetical protein